MPKLSSIVRKNLSSVSVVIEDETVNLEVDVNAVTPALMRQMQEQSDKDEVGALIGFLSTTIASWDVQDENGKTIPVSAEVLESLPVPVLTTLSTGVTDSLTSGNGASSPD